jgi:hypothetical protein
MINSAKLKTDVIGLLSFCQRRSSTLSNTSLVSIISSVSSSVLSQRCGKLVMIISTVFVSLEENRYLSAMLTAIYYPEPQLVNHHDRYWLILVPSLKVTRDDLISITSVSILRHVILELVQSPAYV